jgi:hypothetical protein
LRWSPGRPLVELVKPVKLVKLVKLANTLRRRLADSPEPGREGIARGRAGRSLESTKVIE